MLFGLTMAIGLFAAFQYTLQAPALLIRPIQFSWSVIVTAVVFLVFFSVFLARSQVFSRWFLKTFFLLAVFAGAQTIFGTVLDPDAVTLAALALTLAVVLVPNIAVHDLAILFAIGGITALVGISITPTAGMLALVLFAAYDVVAVYKTKHMVAMAENMIRSRTIFGFLIPISWEGFIWSKHTVRIGEQCMILGSGDIGLPLMFAASLVSTSLWSAVVVALFSAIGLFITHILFLNQQQHRPMAALPPIATMAVVGYLVALMLNL